jgi:hypothetical protein
MDARHPIHARMGMQIDSVDPGSTEFHSDAVLWATKPQLMRCIQALQLHLDTLKLKTRIEPLEWR